MTADQLDEAASRGERRTRWVVGIGLVVIVVLLSVVVMQFWRARDEKESAQADARQLCEQVRALGQQCVALDQARGERGEQGIPGPGPTPAQVYDAVAAWLRANPPKDGRSPTREEIAQAVAEYLRAHPPAKGADGQPGKDGADGQDGAPGADGAPGTPGSPPVSWTIQMPDGTVLTCTRNPESPNDAPTYACSPNL